MRTWREWGGRGPEVGPDMFKPIHVKVTTSTRDQTTAAIKRKRWGPTPAQVGAA
jgi:hypothetical protein